MKKLIFALATPSLLVSCGEKDNSGSGGYSILLETLEATEVGPAGAKLNAKLDLKDVRFASLAYGFYWGRSEQELNSTVEGGQIVHNAFSALMTDLSSNTQYWHQAYVKLDNQFFFGEAKTFTTTQFVTEITLDKSSLDLNVGDSYTLTATVSPEDAHDKTLTWTSSDTEVATVNLNGLVSAVAGGSATITVAANDGSGNRRHVPYRSIRHMLLLRVRLWIWACRSNGPVGIWGPPNRKNMVIILPGVNPSHTIRRVIARTVLVKIGGRVQPLLLLVTIGRPTSGAGGLITPSP